MKPSNTASLRKTLGDIRGYAIDIYQALSHNRSLSRAVAISYAGAILSKVNAALTVPVRNCDVFKTESEMQTAFIAYYNEAYDLKGSKYEIDTCDLKHDVDGILHEYIKWLLATAKPETEGENNGSK